MMFSSRFLIEKVSPNVPKNLYISVENQVKIKIISQLCFLTNFRYKTDVFYPQKTSFSLSKTVVFQKIAVFVLTHFPPKKIKKMDL